MSQGNDQTLPPAPGEIDWRDGNVPFSSFHNDFYYNQVDGLAESRHIFLAGNNLPDAWRGRERFVIGETGFGTGLNFLAAWDCWRKTPDRPTRLDFLSVEKYPLGKADLIRALGRWDEISDLAQAFIAAWPDTALLPGVHRFCVADGAISLTLMIGDAKACLGDCAAKVDCWFLDGFSPAGNSDMWQEDVFKSLARLGKPGETTLATFSAARIVRDGLAGTGFDWERRRGYAYKRDMIVARLTDPCAEIESIQSASGDSARSVTLPRSDRQPGGKLADKPWFSVPEPLSPIGDATYAKGNRTVAIIGGGIAGASCAASLMRQGFEVTLFERHSSVACEASGNPIGMLEPYLTADDSLAGRFYEAGYRFSTAMIAQKAATGAVEADFCGVLALPHNARETSRQQNILSRIASAAEHQARFQSSDTTNPREIVRSVDRLAASEILGLDLPDDIPGGLFFPDAGWVNPPSLVKDLLSGATVCTGTQVTEILLRPQGGAVLLADSGTNLGAFDAVIIAGAMESAGFAQSRFLSRDLVSVRGQISCFGAGMLDQLGPNRSINCVLSHKGYLTPARNGTHVFGATFDRGSSSTQTLRDDNDANIAQLAKILPQLAEVLDPNDLTGRAALRTTTPDHLPLIGGLPDFTAYCDAYGDIDKGRHYARYCNAPYHRDVYICTGFGARGMIGAPLAAEIITSQIAGMPAPVEKSVLDALHPARFIIRALKRGQIA